MEFAISDNEHLHCINENYILHDIKYKYPKSLITKTLTENQKSILILFVLLNIIQNLYLDMITLLMKYY